MCASLMLISGVTSTAQAVSRVHPSVCGSHVARDYESVFRGMPAVSPPPKSGVLPFAPNGSQLYQTVASQIQLTKGAFGYAFTSTSPQRGLRLDWLVSTSVIRVDRKGRAVETVGRRQQSFGVVRDIRKLDFTMNLPGKTGLYRYDLEFKTSNGHNLARYSQYLRVVRPTLNAGLRLAFKNYQPGEAVSIQVANAGTEPIVYGEEIRVKVFNGTSWEASSSFPPLAVHRRALRLNAGEAGPCEKLHIASVAQPGLYRVEKQVSTLFGSRTRLLTASFNVILQREGAEGSA